MPLAPGERLLLLSDGVVDTGDGQERLFGVQRLLEVLAANRQPAHLFDEVMGALQAFGGQSRDDISLCDIRMLAPDQLCRRPWSIRIAGARARWTGR
jgi:serine phosphatase RsbU (regulator of sigma subunit)